MLPVTLPPMKRLIILILSISVIAACIWPFISDTIVAPAQYAQRLQALGLEPTLASVERYVWDSIQPGTTREAVVTRLSPIGNMHFTELGDTCEGISLGLPSVPGEKFSFYVVPDSPTVYLVGLCYSAGVISEISEFSRVEIDGKLNSILSEWENKTLADE